MGCFNRSGFFSHLPLEYGDEMVAFVCCGSRNKHNRFDNCAIGVNSSLTPICLPIFGKYNDYGGIEDVVDDSNYMFFKDKLQISIEWLVDFLHDKGTLTFNEVEYFEEQKKKNELELQTVCEAANVDVKKSDWEIEEEKKNAKNMAKYRSVLKTLFENYHGYYDWKDYYIAVTFEKKEIYDAIVEASKRYGDLSKINLSSIFDNKIETIEKLKALYDKYGLKYNDKTFNLFIPFYKYNITLDLLDSLEKSDSKDVDILKKEIDNILGNKNVYGYYSSDFSSYLKISPENEDGFQLYSDFNHDWKNLKDSMVDMCYFHNAMNRIGAKYEISSYQGQDTYYDLSLAIINAMANVMDKKKERLTEEEDEEDDDL